MQYLIAIMFVALVSVFGCSCSEEKQEEVMADQILYHWNVPENDMMVWHPSYDGRDITIFRAAELASNQLKSEELEEFEKEHLSLPKYVLITYSKELLADNTVRFSQKGVLKKGLVEIDVQKRQNENWDGFYARAFKELVEKSNDPSELVKPPEKTIPSPTPPPQADAKKEVADAGPEKVDKKEVADTDPKKVDKKEPPNKIEKPITKNGLLSYPVFFAWQPGCTVEQALEFHPYVVEGLDRLILNTLTRFGIAGEYLFKLNIEEPNELDYMITLSYSPENMREGIVVFQVRTVEQKKDGSLLKRDFSYEHRRQKRNIGKDELGQPVYEYTEDWREFYYRGFCKVLKMTKVIKSCEIR